MQTQYRLLGGDLVPVEVVRPIRPIGYGVNACEPRVMIRHLSTVDPHGIHEGDVRPVLSRHLVREG